MMNINLILGKDMPNREEDQNNQIYLLQDIYNARFYLEHVEYNYNLVYQSFEESLAETEQRFHDTVNAHSVHNVIISYAQDIYNREYLEIHQQFSPVIAMIEEMLAEAQDYYNEAHLALMTHETETSYGDTSEEEEANLFTQHFIAEEDDLDSQTPDHTVHTLDSI